MEIHIFMAIYTMAIHVITIYTYGSLYLWKLISTAIYTIEIHTMAIHIITIYTMAICIIQLTCIANNS